MIVEMGEDGEPEFIPEEAYRNGFRPEPVEGVVIPRRAVGEHMALVEDYGVDDICRRFEQGKSMSQVARDLRVPLQTLRNFVEREENVEQCLESRKEAGRYWDEAAMEEIQTLGSSSGPGDVARVKEFAAHCRWRAKAYSPKVYGDKIEHTVIPMPLNEVEERLKYLLENNG